MICAATEVDVFAARRETIYSGSYGETMTSKSKEGGRRDSHPKAPDAATRKARRVKHAAKKKLLTKKGTDLRREARAEISDSE